MCHKLSDKCWADSCVSYTVRQWMACVLVSPTPYYKGRSVFLCLLHSMARVGRSRVSYTIWQGLVCVLVSLRLSAKGWFEFVCVLHWVTRLSVGLRSFLSLRMSDKGWL